MIYRFIVGQIQQALGVLWWACLQPKLLFSAAAIVTLLSSALAVNHVTHKTRALYQTQQAQFAQIQDLTNEQSQLGLEVGALASHARLEAWARKTGLVQAPADEVIAP